MGCCVPLRELLRNLSHIRDLPALAAALGAEPCWAEVAPADGCRRMAVAGRAAGFVWLAAEADGAPAAAVARLAARLASDGRLAGILGFYPDVRRLAIASGDRHLVVALDEPADFQVLCLSRLAASPADAWYADRVLAALAGRPAGAAFIRDFRDTVHRVAEAAGPGLRPVERRTLALVQLTRLLFLYFVQSKGWLDGRSDFLRAELDRCLTRRRSVHRHLIEPLFFGTLNRAAPDRAASVRAFGRIPFLNGGLFEPHDLERRQRRSLPNAVWRDALDGLFERYHFTVREGDGDNLTIAPDMLGRVFEGIMESDARKQSGTYYTPAALVRRMVDAGLAALIRARHAWPDTEALEALDRRHPAAVGTALSARVLDPACGSGAFLLGTLERLASLRMLAGEPSGQARRAVLAGNIYGVDLDPMAVRLAELRLWLAVVAGEQDTTPETVRPLPNLDCLVRQGDALMEPPDLGLPPSRLSREVRTARARVVTASGAGKQSLMQRLRELELAAATASLEEAEIRLRSRALGILEAARAPALFATAPHLTNAARQELRGLRRDLHRLRACRRKVVREGELPWLSFNGQFADVMDGGGFDLVAGNPPWVRAEALAPATRAQLARRYRTWRGTAGTGYGHQPDLSVAFVERALELVRPGGAIALVVPSKLATAGYGEALRALLTARTTLHAAAPLDSLTEARFGATVYPMALIATRRPPASTAVVRHRIEPDPDGVPATSLGGAPWILRGGHAQEIIHALQSAHARVASVCRCRLGIKTGADRVFVDPDDVETDLLRPLLRGRDIRGFRAVPRHQLLWAYDTAGRPVKRLPPRAARWIARHHDALIARRDQDGGPPWQLFRTRGALETHRLVWPDLARTLVAAPLIGAARRAVPLNSCYLTSLRTRPALLALTAWLNAPLIGAIARGGATEASGSFRRFTSAVVGGLPFPAAARDDRTLRALTLAALDDENVASALDAQAADLLGLDSREQAALRALA